MCYVNRRASPVDITIAFHGDALTMSMEEFSHLGIGVSSNVYRGTVASMEHFQFRLALGMYMP